MLSANPKFACTGERIIQKTPLIWAGGNSTRLFTNPHTASPLAFTASIPKQKHSRTKSRQLCRLRSTSATRAISVLSSTSATRAISVLSSIILPLQTFFSRVLLLRQQPFSSENLPPERPTTTIAIKTQLFMFRYESVNSTRKFTIVVEIVSLLKKICKRDAPFRAVFKAKTLAVLFSAYPREMKHIPRNLNLPPFCRCLFLWKWCNPFARARARLKHAHSFDRCGGQRSRFLVLAKRSAASGDDNGNDCR